MERNGIISVGNWIIDHIKTIDNWPDRGNLSNIVDSPIKSLGGCSHNVLVGLACLQANLPLWAGGIIGSDADGELVMEAIAQHGIDGRFMQQQHVATSFTDVIFEKHAGYRTFFHYRGANALLDEKIFVNIDVPAKIFHLGYLLLLDKLDAPDEAYGTVAAKVLHMLQTKGYATSVDVVSEQGNRFRKIVTPSLKCIDFLICNEIEAGAIAGISLREQGQLCKEKLSEVANYLLKQGINRMVVIHFPEGGFAMRKNGEQRFEDSFYVPPHEIKGTVGAGDAFCAAALYAIHQDMPLMDILTLANANAHFNLLSESGTGGAVTLAALQQFIKNN
jgi:sugar/nucleoside kinase (ribokinase family)